MKNSYKVAVAIVVLVIVGGGYMYSSKNTGTPASEEAMVKTSTEENATTPSWLETVYKNDAFQIALGDYSIYYRNLDMTIKSAVNANTADAVAFLISKENLENQTIVSARPSIAITIQKSNGTIEELYKKELEYDGPVDGRGTYSPAKAVKIITRTASPTKALDIQFTEAGYPLRIVTIVGGGYQYNLSYDKTASDADILEEIVSTFSLR